jgi:hypothetical protein
MHTCYFVYTNEVLNLGLSNLNHPTRLLHSLLLQMCFSAEQIRKKPPMDEWDKYLYPLIQNITVGCQLSKFRGNWTRRLGWPDALISSTRHCDRSSCWYWPDSILRLVNTHRMRLISRIPLWMLSDVDRTLAPSVRSIVRSLSDISVDQMNWLDSPSYVRSHLDQRLVSHLTLHSLSIWNNLWMKLTPIDLRAIPELSSPRFDKCAPHLSMFYHR